MRQVLNMLQWSSEGVQAQFEALPGWGQTVTNIVPIVFWLVVAVALLALVMSLINMIKNPSSLINFLIGFAILAGLFLLFWAISSKQVPTGVDASSGLYQMIGGGIYLTLFLIAIGFLILLVDLIRGAFKI